MAKGYAKNLEFAFLVSQTFATSNFSHQMMTWLNLDCELTLYLGKRLYTKRYIYLSICQASKRLWGAKETPVASRREVKKTSLACTFETVAQGRNATSYISDISSLSVCCPFVLVAKASLSL